MKTFDLECPLCGAMNYNLYLEESGGWMECRCCHRLIRDTNFNNPAAVSDPAPRLKSSVMGQRMAF